MGNLNSSFGLDDLSLPDDLPEAYLTLRRDIASAVDRIEDILCAVRVGRWIDAHDALSDVRLDLRESLKTH